MLSGIVSRAKQPQKALKIISGMMRRNVMDHFKTESGPRGKWQALAPSTIAWKKKHKYKWILRNSGNLWRRNLPRNDNKKAWVENDVEYAAKHQFGKGRIPQREFMWLSKKALKYIVDYMKNYLTRGG